MLKNYFLFLLFLFCNFNAQTSKTFSESKEIKKIKKFQTQLNAEYKNPEETPLRGENFKNFKDHPFFPIDLKYCVMADFKKTENPTVIQIPTSSGKSKEYREYGVVSFTIENKTYQLSVYQSLALMQQKEYKDYLFLPFRDKTNGKETYGGGKYMDLKIPKDNHILLDFNLSYQPYCAYNALDYNCPIVPEKNWLPKEIRAGVMYDDHYFNH